ncbi:unnamed protein product [Prorocentrum cordatum]|uniref:Endonuclease/exonuclease/phosphatase domain-containing protein n=1 Tax=Prorocentrum cordatum TaxID=2364126 RepID=A0ABN9Y593_9DINO|nr:unnamed protein product [Polarella glacialis]
MGPPSKKCAWSICKSCNNWAYDWKIKRNGGCCAKCDSFATLWADTTSASRKPPWGDQPTKGTYAEVVCRQLAHAVSKLGPDQSMQEQLEHLQTTISQKCAPPKKELPKSAALKQAIGKVNSAKAKLEGVTKRHLDAEKALAKLAEQVAQAAAEVYEAQQEHSKALEEYNMHSVAEGTAAKPEQSGFQVDESLFADEEDLEQTQKDQLAKFREDAKSLQELLERAKTQQEALLTMVESAKKIKGGISEGDHHFTIGWYGSCGRRYGLFFWSGWYLAHHGSRLQRWTARNQTYETAKPAKVTSIFFSNITQWGEKPQKFLNESQELAPIFAFTESHVPQSGITKLKKDLSKDGWKAAVTAATPTRRSKEGNSGGELLIAKAHLATTTFDVMRETLKARGRQDPFRGFTAMTIHLSGGNVVLFSLYLLPKEGMQGSNFEKIKALSTVIGSIADPWIIMADWNMPPTLVEKSGLPTRLGGKVIVPKIQKI